MCPSENIIVRSAVRKVDQVQTMEGQRKWLLKVMNVFGKFQISCELSKHIITSYNPQ